MNFKDEYQKAFSEIKADENFKQSLLAQMNMEKKRKRKPAYVGILAAAAVMVLVVGVGFMTGVLRGKDNSQTDGGENLIVDNGAETTEDMSVNFEGEVYAGQDMSETYVDMNFSGLSWYGDAKTDEELLEIFISYMKDDSLVSMYCTTEETIDENDIMSESEIETLVNRFGELSCTDEAYAGESKYYKAVFEDGLTIKFWMSEDGYLKLQDTETVFKF
ncbi:MAG: hypothetical protein IJZ42_09415 [Lachnospiraceae bacterium]|nr:hypothetical protein [Lachnospiraceae bacterium]